MLLDLSGIVNAQGEKLGVNESLSLDARYRVDGFALIGPVELNGFVQNIGGSLEFFANVKAKISTDCDRCGKTFERDLEFELFEELKKDGAEEPKDTANTENTENNKNSESSESSGEEKNGGA